MVLSVIVIYGLSSFFVTLGSNYSMSSESMEQLAELQELNTTVYGEVNTITNTTQTGINLVNNPNADFANTAIELVTGGVATLNNLIEIPKVFSKLLTLATSVLYIPTFIVNGIGLIISIVVVYKILSIIMKWDV